MNKTETVRVSEALLKAAKAVHEARQEQNKSGKDAGEYNHSLTKGRYTPERAAFYGVIGEMAVYEWLGYSIHDGRVQWVVERDENGKYPAGLRKNADLTVRGTKIEVRNSDNPNNDLAVKHKDVRADALNLQVHVHVDEAGEPTGEVTLVGWIYAKTGKRIGTWDKDRGYWRISTLNKKPMFLFPVNGLKATSA